MTYDTALPVYCKPCNDWIYVEDMATHVGDYHGIGAVVIREATLDEATTIRAGLGQGPSRGDKALKRFEWWLKHGPKNRELNEGPRPWDRNFNHPLRIIPDE